MFQVVLNRCIEKHSPSPQFILFKAGRKDREIEGGEREERSGGGKEVR